MTFLLGLRLAVAGGRRSLLPLALTATGVGIGVLVLLLSLTAQAAVQGRAERSGWRSADQLTPADAPDAALFLSVTDYHEGETLARTYVAALGPQPPVPPGLDRLPRPGEVALSPALRELMAATPDDELDARYPGRVVATIGDEGLASPNDLAAIIGRTPDQLRAVESDRVVTVRGFGSLPSGYAFYLVLRGFLLMGAALLLVPVVVFIVMATRVAAAQRQQRLATLRLAGATRRQTAVVAAVETGLGAFAGGLLGWAAYELGRRMLAVTVSFQGDRFFAEDMAVAPGLLALVLLGIPVLAMVTSVATLRRVLTGPLAASRPTRRPPPSPWVAAPLVVGVGGLLVLAPLRQSSDDPRLDSLAPAFVTITIVGLVIIGPWLCLLAAAGVARVSRRVPGLLAARRMGADSRATFRAVSGVVIAAFSVTFSASLLPPLEGEPYTDESGALRPGVVEIVGGGRVPDSTFGALLDVEGAVALRSAFLGREIAESCEAVAQVVDLPCSDSGRPAPVTAAAGAGDLDLPISRLFVLTDGTPAAENRVRSQAAELLPHALIHTRRDRVDVDAKFIADVEQLQRIGWHFVLVVAACSLTVGMVAGIIERRRPFALLRASGLRLGELREVVFLETAAAMLVTSVVGVGLGLVSSFALALFNDTTWVRPDVGVLATVAVGVLAALLLTTLALPLIDAATRHDAVRFE